MTWVSLRFIILSLTLKSMTRSTLPICVLSNPLLSSSSVSYGTRHTEVIYAHQTTIFHAIEARGAHIFKLFPPFYSKISNKLCGHDKNRKRVELWVKINVFNVYVMYALNSAHVKVRRLNRSRSFGVLFDKPGRIERQVDPNTKLSNVIDSNVELCICRI